jgi:hypothetical protein
METLQQLTEKYKYVRMVKPEDNEELLTFFESISMECGPISMKYCRRPDILKSFEEQSENSYIFVYLNEDETIGGFGSLIVNKLFINGEAVQAAYYADMRLSPTLCRKAHVESRKIYAESLKRYKEIEELKDVKYFYTAILKENEKALQALTKKKRGIIYHELCEYNVVSLLKIRKSKVNPKFTTEISKISNPSKEITLNRLFQNQENHHERVLIKDGNKILLSATIKKMKGRSLIISNAPKYLQFLCRLLPLLMRPALKVNKEFVQRYITDLYFDDSHYTKDELFFVFLQFIRNLPEYQRTHAYSFIHQKNDNLSKSLSRCISQITTGILFQVTSDDEEQTIFPDDRTEVGFDICIS